MGWVVYIRLIFINKVRNIQSHFILPVPDTIDVILHALEAVIQHITEQTGLRVCLSISLRFRSDTETRVKVTCQEIMPYLPQTKKWLKNGEKTVNWRAPEFCLRVVIIVVILSGSWGHWDQENSNPGEKEAVVSIVISGSRIKGSTEHFGVIIGIWIEIWNENSCKRNKSKDG